MKVSSINQTARIVTNVIYVGQTRQSLKKYMCNNTQYHIIQPQKMLCISTLKKLHDFDLKNIKTIKGNLL